MLAHSDGSIWITSSGAGLVAIYRDGELSAALRGFNRPHDVVDDLEGGVWVADSGNNRLIHLSPNFSVVSVIDDPALGFGGPRCLDLTPDGMIIAADKYARRITLIDPEGRRRLIAMLGEPGDADQTEFVRPNGAEAGGSVFYFADGSGRVVRYRMVLN